MEVKMTQAAHTPGPWSCGESFDVISCRFDEMPIVAKVRPVDSKNERIANARLIAAAPELLEALCDMVSDHQCLSEATLQFARAALAKAGIK
jgi:hypothetical protein